MISKLVASAAAALADVPDGATVMIGGFGTAGQPMELIDALLEQGAKDLVIINNNAGNGTTGLAALLGANRVRKIICSFPRQVDSQIFDGLYRSGKIELELVPQGNLAERIRAAGAGIPAFYTPTGVGTELAEGRESRVIDGREYLLEYALKLDYAFLRARRADAVGNLQFHRSQRNFNPVMATAARTALVEVEEPILPAGAMDPDAVHLPGIYIHRMVRVPPPPAGLWPQKRQERAPR